MSSVSFGQFRSALKLNGEQVVRGPDFEPIGYESHRGMPRLSSGNFAATFRLTEKIDSGENQVCIRVWQTAVDDNELGRYRQLGRILKQYNDELPGYIQFATVELFEPPDYGFEIKNAGIQPVVKMDWVNGANLDEFIRDLLQSDEHTKQEKSSIMIKIIDMFQELIRFLHDKGASHGDLSSGNLMIEQIDNEKVENRLRLHIVDFDTFYTEQLRGIESKTKGHKDWQHPGHFDGTLDLSGPTADFFPSLLICITLGALAIDQGMPRTNRGRYGPEVPDGSGIIIEAKDLIDPENSAVISELREIDDPRIDSCLRDMDRWLGDSPQVEFPPSLKTDWSSESRSAGTAVSHSPISSRTTDQRQASFSRVRFNRPDDVITHVEGKQPAIRWLLIDLKRNQKRLGGRYLEAIEGLIEHYGGIEEVENDLRCEYAFALKREGKWGEARSIAEQCHLDANIAFLLTQLLARRKGEDNWGRIIEIADNVLESSPGNVNMLTAKAMARYKKGDFGTLSESYEDAEIKSGRDPRVLLSLVWDANREREYLTGANAFFELLSIDEGDDPVFKPSEIANVLGPGFTCLNRAREHQKMTYGDFLEGMCGINPKILLMETRPPSVPTKKSIVFCLNHLGNPNTAQEGLFQQLSWMLQTNMQLGRALCSLGTLGTGEAIDGMDRVLQDFFRKFNPGVEIDGELQPVFLSWEIELPFCAEYPPGTWTKFAEDVGNRINIDNEPSGLD